MKRFTVLAVIAFALSWTGARSQTLPLPPPTSIECLTANVNGVEMHRDLFLPIPTTDERAIMHEFFRFGQLLTMSGDRDQVDFGYRLMQKVAFDSLRQTVSSSYVVGRVCYVLKTYCDPICTGQGCATIRVPSIK